MAMAGSFFDCNRLRTDSEMKRLFSLLPALLMALSLQAQDNLLQSIIAANTPKSLQASFTMVRHSPMLVDDLKAEGMVYMLSPDKIRWEVLKPTPRVTVFNGDIPAGRKFAMPQEQDFTCTKEENGNLMVLMLTPLRKDLKRLFTKIVLNVDKSTLSIRDIRLFGRDGDETFIRFGNLATDVDIAPELFIKE